MEKNNEVTNFMYYMYNKWCIGEAKKVFGDNLGEHIFSKWVHQRSRLGDLYWYSELDDRCRTKIVERANEIYNKSIQAQGIIERRMAVEKDIKVNLQNLVYYGAYYMGALDAVQKITQTLFASGRKPKGEDWIYIEAEWKLITKSKRNMQLWLDDTQMRYRNHKRDKKGKLESCECYFVEYRNIITEVR